MEWVDVNVDLPDEPGWYLVWEKYYSSSIGIPVIAYYDYGFTSDVSEDYSEVTHWMPLPKAPGAEGGGKMKFQYKIYVVTDDYGGKQVAVSAYPNDDVFVGAQSRLGVWKQFESEAYHLERWCKDNGFGYREIDMDYEV